MEGRRERLRAAGVARVDAIALGSHPDGARLAAIVESGRERGAVVRGDASSDLAVQRLRTRIVSSRAEITGAPQVWSTPLDDARGGAVVFAEIDASSPLVVTLDGEAPRATEPEHAPPALVERAVAEARIRALTVERRAAGTTVARRQELERETLALAKQHRILTDLTAMVVLETDSDFARFNIDRDALHDIPVVGRRGVQIVSTRAGLPAFRTADFARTAPRANEIDNPNDGAAEAPRPVVVDADSIIVIPKVRFLVGSDAIPAQSLEIIDALATLMKRHVEFQVLGIAGHADEPGGRAANYALSVRRAQAVLKALVARGVPASRLRAHGFGADRIEDPARDEDARGKNRRVEFKILVAGGQPTGVEDGDVFFRDQPYAPPDFPQPRLARWKPTPSQPALEGRFADVMRLLDTPDAGAALAAADAWVREAPGDLLAWTALGRSLEALGRDAEAARAYGSLVDLAARTEHRRAGAAWLEAMSVRYPPAGIVAIDAYRRALADRPDHPSSHHLYAMALARAGRTREAFEVVAAALGNKIDHDRFRGALETLKADAGLLAAAIARAEPARAAEIMTRAAALDATVVKVPVRVLALTWETDSSDLDLVATDPTGNTLSSAFDATSGYGPELFFSAEGALGLQVEVALRGPNAVTFGNLGIVTSDGRGGLGFEDRPFVVMKDGSRLSLGTVEAPRAKR
jgi:outer membrane protein OmpA-like peptidoglycan-associated protein